MLQDYHFDTHIKVMNPRYSECPYFSETSNILYYLTLISLCSPANISKLSYVLIFSDYLNLQQGNVSDILDMYKIKS